VSDLTPAVVGPLLRGRFGRPYRFVETCTSTQHLVGGDDPEGAAVAADHQTAGRGRLGRVWLAPPGRAILCSLMLRPVPPAAIWPELSLVAGTAIAAAVRTVTALETTVGHPNDVLVGGRKLAGILAEASSGRVVLGFGVNVGQTIDELPSDAPKPPTSLRVELDREIERAPLLAEILLELENGYDAWTILNGRYHS
jgi:BirA family transcriptional regulator, biotin operon repressor / biotin---[acetyl-CoA-carboxylase] ligase